MRGLRGELTFPLDFILIHVVGADDHRTYPTLSYPIELTVIYLPSKTQKYCLLFSVAYNTIRWWCWDSADRLVVGAVTRCEVK